MLEQSTKTRVAEGPRGLPLIGSAREAIKDPLGLLLRAWRDHGDVTKLRLGPFRYFLVNDADGVHHVLVENYRNYKKSRNYGGLKLLLGEGLITSEGDHWRRQRKLTQPAFHKARLAGFAERMVAATRRMLDRWEGEIGRGPFDVHAEMMRLTFGIVGLTLFSVDLDAEADGVGRAMAVALKCADDHAGSLVHFPLFVPTPHNQRFRRAIAEFDRLVYRIIAERRASKAPPDDLLSMLMSARDEETRETMTDRQLRDEIITLVLAGHETTANALTWTFHLLSKHPDVERRLAREVVGALGDRAPVLDDLPSLAFTRAVVEEAMRLYPPVWVFEREAIEDDIISGYHVPAGSIVSVCPYVLHRHPAHWENPEGFDPDRFSPARSAGRHRYAYLPFGAGPRQCIGNAFALLEAQIILAMVVQGQRLELVSSHAVKLDPLITLRPARGVLVTRAPRARAAAQPSAAPRADG
jgi:cytochrome P450